jgi:hypothetical protein
LLQIDNALRPDAALRWINFETLGASNGGPDNERQEQSCIQMFEQPNNGKPLLHSRDIRTGLLAIEDSLEIEPKGLISDKQRQEDDRTPR